MKKLQYILFAMSLTLATTVSAQELAGSQVQISNKAVSLSADTQLLVGMDVTVPADLEFSTNSMLTLTPILMEKGENGANKTLPAMNISSIQGDMNLSNFPLFGDSIRINTVTSIRQPITPVIQLTRSETAK